MIDSHFAFPSQSDISASTIASGGLLGLMMFIDYLTDFAVEGNFDASWFYLALTLVPFLDVVY